MNIKIKTNIKEYQKEWVQKNPEKIKEYKKEYAQKNPEKVKECRKKWVQKNPEKVKEYQKEYNAKKIEEINKLISKIKQYYECSNPQCNWVGKFEDCCLDFHHLKEKIKSISVMRTSSIATIIKEINKCTIVCSNCHRMITYQNLDCSNFRICNIEKDMENK